MGEQNEYRLYVGSYPPSEGECGIYLLALDKARRSCSIVQANAETANPSYLVSAGDVLYAANEQSECAQVSMFATQGDGPIVLRDTYRTHGAGTCQIALDPRMPYVYGANYESGSIVGCHILSDGLFGSGMDSVQQSGHGPNSERQEGPHVHMVGFAPDAPALISVNLGTDALMSYAVGEHGLEPAACAEVLHVSAGEGPRMVAHHPTLPFTALITELGNHLIMYRRHGASLSSWEQLDSYRLVSDEFGGEALAAHVLFSPDGRYLYASVRGPNQIVVFSVDKSGALVKLSEVSSGGSWPRHMELSPDGTLLAVANERSCEVVVFEVDKANGLLAGEVARCAIANPTCAVWRK
ncbi:lactonase family protein [Raoultibacter phocaeensis]|uniref:lactonase family protein n=1 Tax=Raoultibacter phocaeensis TaxID=2479841 RepID=UPI001119F315|nr:lactonase family protein [Raoultibacter phocaeensis]